ncbi:hypothetical protein GGC47_003967 [Bosea sp. OAE752]|uniref:hypothetical protein n=1 Tax=Bosea sp. OAE752 TaxID=2663873 RepID=UPI003D1F497A
MTAAEKLALLKKTIRQQQHDSVAKATGRLMRAGILTRSGNLSPIYKETKPSKAK